MNLIKELFKRENINDKNNIDDDNDNLVNEIRKRKSQIFKEIQKARSFEGVKELIDSLNCDNWLEKYW